MDKVIKSVNTSLLVPVEAVFVPNEMADSKQQFVYKLDIQDKTVLVQVNVSRIGQMGAEISAVNDSALVVGDRVIAAGSHYLTNGQQVRPWTQERGL